MKKYDNIFRSAIFYTTYVLITTYAAPLYSRVNRNDL